MYPLHRYLPNVFGSYRMDIEDEGPKEVIIRKLPDDIEAFKKAAEKSPTGVPVKTKVKPFNSNKVRSREDDLFEMREKAPPPPSYDIHFLQHASQAITEQPPNVRLVDDFTRAEVTSPHVWIKDRPSDWDDTIETHQIYNPGMTNTVKEVVLPREEEIRHPAGRNIQEVSLAGQPVPHPLQIPMRLPATNNMTNTIKPDPRHDIARERKKLVEERMQMRESASKKRRSKARKLMNLVTNRARVASIMNSNTKEEVVPTRTSGILSGRRGFVPPAEEYDERVLNEKYINSKRVREQSTITPQKQVSFKEPMAKDWSPFNDQKVVNKILVDRLSDTMHYAWQNPPQTA